MRAAGWAFALLAALATPAAAQIPNGDHEAFLHCIDGHRTTDERIKACQRAVDNGTGDRSNAQYMLVDLYVRQHAFDRALNVANFMLSLYDSSALGRPTFAGNPRGEVLAERAWVYATMGRLEDALADVDAYAALASEESSPLLIRCKIRAIANSGLDLALEDCNKAVARHSNRSAYLAYRALVYLRMNRLPDALADCNSAVADDARDIFARYLRGIVERRMGDTAAGDDDIHWAAAHDIGIGEAPAAYGVTP